MTATLVLKYFQNDNDIVSISCSRSAHTIKNFILQKTVDFDTSNLYARSCIVKFNLNRINVNTSCWNELSFQFTFSGIAVFNKSWTEQRISNLGSPV